jgi:glycosyltransferase involved in cell wall biosynthesis
MRVGHVNQDPGVAPGRHKGAAVHVTAMRRAFAQSGCEVLDVDASTDGGVREALESWHSTRPVDLVYERYALGARGGTEFARRAGVPKVVDIEREVFLGAQHTFAVSSEVAAYVMRHGVSEDRVTVQPNAVDTELFHAQDGAALRAELGIEPGAFVLGFHGRLRAWHGFEHLVHVAERLLARGVPVHLLVVGSGDFEEHLADTPLVAASTLVNWVPHERVGEYVACFDALPLTYAADQPCYFSPLKLLEAMAGGVVPFVPDLGDLPEAVDFGLAGVVYAAGDFDGLADELALFVGEADRRRRLSQSAVAFAGRRSWRAVASKVLECAGLTPAC